LKTHAKGKKNAVGFRRKGAVVAIAVDEKISVWEERGGSLAGKRRKKKRVTSFAGKGEKGTLHEHYIRGGKMTK